MVGPEIRADKQIIESIEQAEGEIGSGILKTAIAIPVYVIGVKLFLYSLQPDINFQSDLLVVLNQTGKFMIDVAMIGGGFVGTVRGVGDIICGHGKLVGAQTAKFMNSLQSKEIPQN